MANMQVFAVLLLIATAAFAVPVDQDTTHHVKTGSNQFGVRGSAKYVKQKEDDHTIVKPVEYQHVDYKPVEYEHVDYKPVEYRAVDHRPVQHRPVEHRPVQHKPAEHRPVEHKSVEHKPVEHKPVEHRPVEYKPRVNATVKNDDSEDTVAKARIVQQDTALNADGSFYNSWNSENGISVQEHGEVKKIGDSEVAVSTGEIAYTDDEGKQYYLRYVADEKGFQVQGDHLPTPPPVPQAIREALEYIAAHPYVETTTMKYQEEYKENRKTRLE